MIFYFYEMNTYPQKLFEQILLMCDFRACCRFDFLPRELIERILCTFDFDAWRCARFVCRVWAKICAECDWKTDEFVQYRFRDKNKVEILLAQKTSNYYEPYLPNDIKHGMSYHYYNDSENIYKMNLWIYGKCTLEISYAYTNQDLNSLFCVMDNMKLHIICFGGYYSITILDNKNCKQFGFHYT